jgi:hypothetical protein
VVGADNLRRLAGIAETLGAASRTDRVAVLKRIEEEIVRLKEFLMGQGLC